MVRDDSPGPCRRSNRIKQWTVAATFLLLLAVPLGGCVGGLPGGADDAAEGASAGDGAFQTSTTIDVNLDDFDLDVEWILLELVLDAETTLRSTLDADLVIAEGPGLSGYTRETRDACYGWHVGEAGIFYFVTPGGGWASVRAMGQEAGASADPHLAATQGVTYLIVPFNRSAGEVVPVLIAFDRPQDFAGTDSTFTVTVEADPAVRWRIAATGTVDCGTRLADFDGGPYVSSNPLVHAEDLVAGFDVEQAGFGWFLAAANQAYDVEVAGPNGTTWHRQGAPLLTEPEGVATPLDLGAGEWELRVNELRGTGITGASYVVMDLPTWAVQDLWPDDES